MKISMTRASLFLVFCLFVSSMLMHPPRAFALTGRVVNQTQAQSEPNVVVSYIHHAQGNVTVLRDTTDAEGRFALDLPADPPTDPPPMLMARYKNVDYPGRLPSESDAVEIPVFETSESDTALSLTAQHVILDASTREVTYILVVNNGGNHTYITGGDHGHGLEMPLPEGVTSLSRAPEGMHLHDNILIDPRPIIPGQSQTFFSFVLPASNEILQTIAYPTGQFDLLVLPPDAGAEPLGLHEHGTVNFGGQTFRRFGAANLTPGARVGLRLTIGSVVGQQNVLVWVISGIALICGIAAVILSRRPRAQKATSTAAGRRVVLLEQIADLDERFENGALSEADYHARRNVLKAEVAELRTDRQVLMAQIADLDEQFENGDLEEATYRKQREAIKARIVALSDGESAR